MGLICGLLAPVTSSAIRNGAARDAAYLKRKLNGIADASVALVVGHTHTTLNAGVTAGYVGALQETVFNMKAAHGFEDRLAPKLASVPIQIPSNKTWEVDAYMKKHHLDLRDHKQRARASVAMTKDRQKDWIEREKHRQVPDVLPPPPAKRHRLSTASAPSPNTSLTCLTPSQVNARTPPLLTPEETAEDYQGMPLTRSSFIHLSSSLLSFFPSPSLYLLLTFPFSVIDPRLLVDSPVALENLCSLVFDTPGHVEPSGHDERSLGKDLGGNLVKDDESTEETLVEALTSTGSEDSIWALPGNEFVSFLSKINVFKNLGKWDHSPASEAVSVHVPTGGSRDQPTPFLFYCTKGDGGCGYSTWNLRHLQTSHAVTCDGRKIEDKDKPFACSEDRCNTAFATQRQLDHHVASIHKWVARTCKVVECRAKTQIIMSSQEYYKHCRDFHDDIVPQQCSLQQDCHSDHIFSTKKNLSRHLQKFHGASLGSSGQIEDHRPLSLRYKISSQCPKSGCTSTKIWTSESVLRLHLNRVHKIVGEECDRLLPPNDLAQKAALKKTTKNSPEESHGCPVSGCKSESSFTKHGMARHFMAKTMHGMGEDKAWELVISTFTGPVVRRGSRRSPA